MALTKETQMTRIETLRKELAIEIAKGDAACEAGRYAAGEDAYHEASVIAGRLAVNVGRFARFNGGAS